MTTPSIPRCLFWDFKNKNLIPIPIPNNGIKIDAKKNKNNNDIGALIKLVNISNNKKTTMPNIEEMKDNLPNF